MSENERRHMERKEKTTELLKHELTTDELQEIGKRMAKALLDLADAQDELKSVQGQIKSRITIAEATAKQCAEKVRSGYEYRQTPCIAIYDYDAARVKYVREDTGELLSERSMTDDERQGALALR